MDDDKIRESRRQLRQIQDHLNLAALRLGAQQDAAGMVDIFYHGDDPSPELNYLIPRKNTAWISGKDIEPGMKFLEQQGRDVRFCFIEGLFLPRFAESLAKLDLAIANENHLLTYGTNDHENLTLPSMPSGIYLQEVSDTQGTALWWYVYRNAHFDLVSNPTVSPFIIGTDLYHIHKGFLVDIMMTRNNTPIGVCRMTVLEENKSAQIVALSMLNEARTQDLLRLLEARAMQIAMERKCELIFTAGADDRINEVSRANGFVDCGSMVCYAKKFDILEDAENDSVEQSIYTLRRD